MVEDDEVWLALSNGRECGEPIFSQAHLVTRRPKEITQHQSHVLVVIGEQQVTHYLTAA